jgi:hypothetical protein
MFVPKVTPAQLQRPSNRHTPYLSVGIVMIFATILFRAIAPFDSLPDDVRLPAILATFIIWLIGLILWIAGCRMYADSKGYATVLGLLLGFLGLFGLIILLVLPRRAGAVVVATTTEQPQVGDTLPPVKPTGLTWHCPCGEINLLSATHCRSCDRLKPTQ